MAITINKRFNSKLIKSNSINKGMVKNIEKKLKKREKRKYKSPLLDLSLWIVKILLFSFILQYEPSLRHQSIHYLKYNPNQSDNEQAKNDEDT